MKDFGFCGPAYQTTSLSIAAQRCVNLYPEFVNPSLKERSVITLNSRPGLRKLCTLDAGPIRGFNSEANDVYVVGGSKLYQLFQDGSYKFLADVGYYNAPVQMIRNGSQLLIKSGQNCYIYSGALVGPVVQSAFVDFIDGYFIAQQPNSQNVQISGINDGITWNTLDFKPKQGATDPLYRIIASHRELYLIGEKTVEVWFDSGNPDFPFDRNPSAFMEHGTRSPYSFVLQDDSIFGLFYDASGGPVARRTVGYNLKRISNHAIEALWRTYPNIQNTVGSAYVENGHSFVQFDFPDADATWVYDVATDMWHQRQRWDATTGVYRASLARYSTSAWGKNICGSYIDGSIYISDPTYHTDDGAIIRWLRSTPHISNELKWYFHRQLVIDMQVGSITDGTNPSIGLRISNDGGYTWGNERISEGMAIGEYRRRVVYRQLGRSRNRVYEASGSFNGPVAIVDADLDVQPGNGT